nr:hypothetical protein StreXyl84_55110 [Streptomyces sp. Xyl84]
MAKTQLNVRVDEGTARAARERALARGMSVNRYIEELVRQDTGETGRTFVEAAADFMKSYEAVFAQEFDGASVRRPAPNAAEDGATVADEEHPKAAHEEHPTVAAEDPATVAGEERAIVADDVTHHGEGRR